MVQRTGDQGRGNVIFVQNNFYYDAFFLKAIGKGVFLLTSIVVADVLSSPQWSMHKRNMSSQ